MAEAFAGRVLRWYDLHGRKDLPWQRPRTPYRVWLSEVMLQQTQVATVVPYFLRFVEKFATLRKLADADLDDVLALWSGLGYYSRARNLHRAAQICVERHRGALPRDFDALVVLPGIGRSTAGAILAQAHGLRFPILDGNVRRVLARYHGVRAWPGIAAVSAQLWKFAELHTPRTRIAEYSQAIMDLGATLCTRTRPRCADCPIARDCVANRDGITGDLPARKPTRNVPTRATLMLLLRDGQGRILLERRPHTGVWAQLWSLPEAQDLASAHIRVRREHARGALPELRELKTFVHTFSHYKLNITPLTGEIGSSRRVEDAPNRRWLHLREAAALGLPAPVRKLIELVEKS
jgi:A/G-specific adenine glycosylase